MKQQKSVKIALCAILCVVLGYLGFAENRSDKLKDLMLDNIEALATSEGDVSYDCFGTGSVDCHGHYAEYMIEGYSLDLE